MNSIENLLGKRVLLKSYHNLNGVIVTLLKDSDSELFYL